MSGLFKSPSSPAPPPPPPPPANPPTYASAATQAPFKMSNPLMAGFGNSILTSPGGTPNDPSLIGRKTLLGQ